MDEIGRRDLLKGAAALGLSVAAGSLASCGESAAPGAAAPATTAPMAWSVERLASLIKGNVVLPRDPRYDSVRLLYQPRYDNIRPTAVVEVADANDVATVVQFARDSTVPLRIRNGGHSNCGYSTHNGIVLDVRKLTDLTVSDDGTTAKLGGGFTTLNAYRALWDRTKKVIPAGLCPTVGISGLTTGGGLGAFDRQHGTTSDNLIEVELVTADGKVVRANERENADLFWATRGGGGGTFGVVTSLTFKLVPADMPFTSATYQLPWSTASKLVPLWQNWLSTTPRSTWSIIQLATQDPKNDEPSLTFEVIHAGPGDEVPSIVGDLLFALGVQPLDVKSETTDFLTNESNFYCKGLHAEECQLADAFPSGKIPRPSMFMASDVAKYQWPADGVDVLVEGIAKRQKDKVLTPDGFDPLTNVGKLLIEPMDGAINDVAPDATAFVHRDAICDFQYQARWPAGASEAAGQANIDWVFGLYQATKDYRSGAAYQNYIDPTLQNWQRAYFGANLERLRDIKKKVDPDNFFSHAQSIEPTV